MLSRREVDLVDTTENVIKTALMLMWTLLVTQIVRLELIFKCQVQIFQSPNVSTKQTSNSPEEPSPPVVDLPSETTNKSTLESTIEPRASSDSKS